MALTGLIALAIVGWKLIGEEGTTPKQELKPMTATQEQTAKPAIDLEIPAKLEAITFAVG